MDKTQNAKGIWKNEKIEYRLVKTQLCKDN